MLILLRFFLVSKSVVVASREGRPQILLFDPLKVIYFLQIFVIASETTRCCLRLGATAPLFHTLALLMHLELLLSFALEHDILRVELGEVWPNEGHHTGMV